MTTTGRSAATVGPLATNVAKRVRQLRLARGWSCRQLADECAKLGATHLTAACVSNMERGIGKPGRGGRPRTSDTAPRPRREATIDELYLFSRLFGLPVDALTAPGPHCEHCNDAPPPGYACLKCGGKADWSERP